MKEFYSKIAGVSQNNEDGSSRQEAIEYNAKVGKPLILNREPKNKFDPNAISVWVFSKGCFGSGTHQLGYLEARVASELAPLIDQGVPVNAVITEITGGGEGQKYRGVNIKISY